MPYVWITPAANISDMEGVADLCTLDGITTLAYKELAIRTAGNNTKRF